MKKTTKKLAFSATTVRTLQQSMSDEQLQEVAGGGTVAVQLPTGGANPPQNPNTIGGSIYGAGTKTGVTVSRACPSQPTWAGDPTVGAC